jgi:hypothetical protein
MWGMETNKIAKGFIVTKRDDKRKLRILKRTVKRDGNKHRRNAFKLQMGKNPEEAHLAEEDLGGSESKTLNALDRPVGMLNEGHVKT